MWQMENELRYTPGLRVNLLRRLAVLFLPPKTLISDGQNNGKREQYKLISYHTHMATAHARAADETQPH